MKLSLPSFKNSVTVRSARKKLTPKLTKATSNDQARPMLGRAHLMKDGDGYALLATDGYIMVKVPILVGEHPEAVAEADKPVPGPIPLAAMKHIESLPNDGINSLTSTFEAREGEVEVGEDTIYKRRDIGGEPPAFEKVLEGAEEMKNPVTIGFDAVLLKNLADALGTQQLRVTIDMDQVDTPEGRDPQYLKPLVIEPQNKEGDKDGRLGLQMPIRVHL